jgi:thiol-disulfide isomerase/thioredoxin/mono/diheme cytochrome c family protein
MPSNRRSHAAYGFACCFIALIALWLNGAIFLVASGAAEVAEVRQGPQRLAPAEHGVGCFVADCAFKDLAGQEHRLSDFGKKKFLVVAMTSTSCPLSKKYLPTLTKLAETYSPKEVGFLAVNPVSVDDAAEMQAAQKLLGEKALYVADGELQLATALRATTTTDVIVLDADRTIVYHGAIDDQYGFGYSLEAPRRNLLVDALDALLAGLRPAVAATDAPGCVLDVPAAEKAQTDDKSTATIATWHNRVARIVQQNCVECHRAGGVAPFALETSEQLIAHGAMIRQVIERGVMPPWFAAPAEPGHVSPWSNDRTLGERDKSDLLAWLASEHPLGEATDAAQPRKYPEGWVIGQPDVVFAFDKPVPVEATGTMPYQTVMIETNLPEDRWVQAIEVRPSARDVVHHVVVSLAGSSDPAANQHNGSEERAGFWALYVPGSSTLVYPSGFAKRLPRGTRLRFQMHYTPNGTATEDITQIGMIFAKEPPKHEVRVAGIINPKLNIPAGAANHEEVAWHGIPSDVQVLAFLPHMHLRGKACRYDLIKKNGETEVLLDVPQYDFNWQLLYRYAEPKSLSQGDRIRFTAWFDNSENNPANPDPKKEVRWGPQTSDEMHLGYVEYIVPNQATTGAAGEPKKPNRMLFGITIEALFDRIDKNLDGSLSKEEFIAAAQTAPKLKDMPEAQQALFAKLDGDKSNELVRTEFEKLLELVPRQ